jgi:fructokinase
MNLKSMVYVFGEVLFDCFLDGSRVIGGAPFNVAWNLQAFGLAPQFISRIGDDLDGKEITTTMTNWQMSQSALQVDSIHPTGLVRVEIHHGEPHYNIVADSAYDFIDANSLSKDKTDGILYHGSLALRNPISLKALQVLKSNHHGKIFVDVNLRDPWWQKETLFPLLDDANWVKLNEHELEVLCPEVSNLESAIKIFSKQFDLDILIVTLGEKGAIAWNKQQFIKVQPIANTQVVDTVGAGDAFASVFLLGLSKEWSIETTLERAQAFAGEIVKRQGATINDLEFYQKFSQQWN